MDEVLARFARALRAAGVRASTSEEVDAARAVAVLGLDDRARVKAALRATLVKDRRDLPPFDRLFDAFFSAGAGLPDIDDPDFWARAAGMLDGIASEVAAAMAEGNSAALEALLAEAQESIDLPLRYPFQRGLLAYRLRERLEVERIRRVMNAIGPALVGVPPPGGLDAGGARAPRTPGGQGGGMSAGAAKGGNPDPMRVLEAAIDGYVQRAMARAAANVPGAAERSGIFPPFELDQKEADAIEKASALLARRLREQTARRRRRARRGHVDLRATLRHSVATGGVPFTPRWRHVRADRPNLVALCDVSPSMRGTTRFTLMFLHSIAAEVARVRSFFFVDKAAEVTGFFRERRIGRAVARALAEADLDVGARTDYGASLRDFDRRFGNALDRRTTLLVLGDARSNYTDPGIEILRGWRRKVKRIVFLNPEAQPFWGSGDSVMSRYAPLCDVVAECRTPSHLERVVDALAR